MIDVGYAGVIGADRLFERPAVYGSFPPDNARGDTYGPVFYYAYVPFESAAGLERELGRPPRRATAPPSPSTSASSAAVPARPPAPRAGRSASLLAYAWVTFPFTLLVANSNTNDASSALLVAAALLVLGAARARGAAAAPRPP